LRSDLISHSGQVFVATDGPAERKHLGAGELEYDLVVGIPISGKAGQRPDLAVDLRVKLGSIPAASTIL